MEKYLVEISADEAQILNDLSAALDDRTDLGDGDRTERAFWKRASNTVSRIGGRCNVTAVAVDRAVQWGRHGFASDQRRRWESNLVHNACEAKAWELAGFNPDLVEALKKELRTITPEEAIKHAVRVRNRYDDREDVDFRATAEAVRNARMSATR